ncbi:hypothetical protein vseg_013810 [Gypsophila vaccaria]
MVEEESYYLGYHGFIIPLLFLFLIIFSGTVTKADTLTKAEENDREILLNLKAFLEQNNKMNRGKYSLWNVSSTDPCTWAGISCDVPGTHRVTGIDLSSSNINGNVYADFAGLTELRSVDLSSNTLSVIPSSLSGCGSLRFLNLSHNMIGGGLSLSGLSSLEVLDLSLNKIGGEIGDSFPGVCGSLRVLNISMNNFTGSVDGRFDGCPKLEHVDLSANQFSGGLWTGFGRLKLFNVGENRLDGSILPWYFEGECNLQVLDLSVNYFVGEFPEEISNCKELKVLILAENKFTGNVPESLGSVSSLEVLIMGGNKFSREIPESLLNCKNLVFLDLSKNYFLNDVPAILGRFTQVRVLVLHGNGFTGGLNSSGILRLPSISRLDLSYNNFVGSLPIEISEMKSLQFLNLAFNYFSGEIPSKYGSLTRLQALDLSYNKLTGSIPKSLGNLTSLLWLMLANNSLTGEIPPELGNCSSLIWLNLANNNLHGKLPTELTNIGSNPMPTFLLNRDGKLIPDSGECLTLRRWIPATYPPFSFAFTILTRKSCRNIWDKLLKGYGLFPMCLPGTNVQTLQTSGYVQLAGNKFSGRLPSEIGRMKHFSMLQISDNNFNGAFPSEIGNLPLVVLNVSDNNFSGSIPPEMGNMKCLQDLDLSLNNFSGIFPTSLNELVALSKFNVSFNPLISGVIPSTGQLATFEGAYLGDPLLVLPSFINSSSKSSSISPKIHEKRRPTQLRAFWVVIILLLVMLVVVVLSILVYSSAKSSSENNSGYPLKDLKYRHDFTSNSSTSPSSCVSDAINIIRLDERVFTHSDILKATSNFSEDKVIGRGGYATVYEGVLPDGRKVAVKKLLRGGIEGEREFRAEMEVLTQQGVNWPHPNLVNLYGWCLDGADKLLVYEYMEGGTLEDFISDKTRLTWKMRVEIAMDVARALVFLHHECYPSIVHRDVKANNVLLDRNGKARVTDFGLARVVDAGETHVTTTVAGTVGYVAPEYGQTWQATTKGDVYSFGVLVMELATGRRAVDGNDECLLEWARRVTGNNRQQGLGNSAVPGLIVDAGAKEGTKEMSELLRIGLKCTAETPQARPNMKEVLSMLVKILGCGNDVNNDSYTLSVVCDV